MMNQPLARIFTQSDACWFPSFEKSPVQILVPYFTTDPLYETIKLSTKYCIVSRWLWEKEVPKMFTYDFSGFGGQLTSCSLKTPPQSQFIVLNWSWSLENNIFVDFGPQNYGFERSVNILSRIFCNRLRILMLFDASLAILQQCHIGGGGEAGIYENHLKRGWKCRIYEDVIHV